MGFTQIVNNLAKIHYRWGQSANVVITHAMQRRRRGGAFPPNQRSLVCAYAWV